MARLDSLLLVLKSCKGEVCVKPWHSLHPKGDVLTLEDALSSQFDHFDEVEQKKLRFNRCENGYLLDAEGSQFGPNRMVYRDGLPWHHWVGLPSWAVGKR